jgi:hypothetical protein
VSTWLRRRLPGLGSLLLILCILGTGLLVVLVVQPAPPSYAEGWSAPRPIDEVKSGYPHRAVIDGRDRIHLVWHKQASRQPAAVYARLDRQGQLLGEPVLLSTPGIKAENVSVALTDADVPLVFWIEKGHEGGEQRLLMGNPDTGERRVLSVSGEIMRDLAVTTGQLANGERRILLVWSDSRLGLYDLYLTALDGGGGLVVSERRITDSGREYVYEPTVALDSGVMHVVYFADDALKQELKHQVFQVDGTPLSEAVALELMSQKQADLTGSSRRGSYPILAVAAGGGQARLYESLGRSVRHRQLDGKGDLVLPPEAVLAGGRGYSPVSHTRRGDQEWLTWADLSSGQGDLLQVYTALLDDNGRPQEPERLTFLTTSALSPLAVVDSAGGRHVIWQQSVRAYTYELRYANNLDPAPQTIWQRLGFAGPQGWLGFLFALGESLVLAVVMSFVRIWRLAIGVAGVIAIRQLARWVQAMRRHVHLIACAVLLLLLAALMRPEAQTLGQAPIVVAAAAHWTMVAVASAVLLFLGWAWRQEAEVIWVWVAVGAVWLVVYYALNILLILREGFAV